jgi:hypothetical protein
VAGQYCSRSSAELQKLAANCHAYPGNTCLRNPTPASRIRYGGLVLLLNAVNKTRPSQKTINTRGKMPITNMCVLLSKAGNSSGRAKNIAAEAINSPKHMRHRCRAIHYWR